jgi:RHS repeat-associated protein
MQIGGEWVATDRLGSVVRKGTTNYKYAPYGQEIGGATANDTNKFATYTRDSLSGLDYALNRYYKPEWGRFTSPDPSDQNVRYGVPGSWNMYAYSDGDPITFYDPEGLGVWSAIGGFFKKIAGTVSEKTVSLFSSRGQDVAEADEGVGDPASGDYGQGEGGGVPPGIATSRITYPTFARQLGIYVPFIAGVAGPQLNVYFIPGTAYRSYQLCAGLDLNVAFGKFVSYGVLTTVNDTDIRKIIDGTLVTNIPDGNANVSTSAAYYLGYGVTANPQGTAHGPLASVPGAGVGIGLHSSCGP